MTSCHGWIGKGNNMFKVKIDTKPGTPELALVPPLKDVLLRVYNQVPSLQFEVLRDDAHRQTLYEGEEYVRYVTVFQGFQKVGTVTFVERTHRGEKKHVFCIESDNIKKARGERNTVKTEKPRLAVSKIIEFFKPKSMDYVGAIVYKEVREAARDLDWSSKRAVFNGYQRSDDINVRIVGFLVDAVKSGWQAIESENTHGGIKDIVTDKLTEAWYAYDIMSTVFKAIDGQEAMAVKQMRDGTFVTAYRYLQGRSESYVTATYRSREDVPQPYLDKLNMLQFVEPNQPIRNVGVRMENSLKESLYVLLDGDILTDS